MEDDNTAFEITEMYMGSPLCECSCLSPGHNKDNRRLFGSEKIIERSWKGLEFHSPKCGNPGCMPNNLHKIYNNVLKCVTSIDPVVHKQGALTCSMSREVWPRSYNFMVSKPNQNNFPLIRSLLWVKVFSSVNLDKNGFSKSFQHVKEFVSVESELPDWINATVCISARNRNREVWPWDRPKADM